MDSQTAVIRYQNWINIIREWTASGMTKRDFCRINGIHEKSFYYYQRQVRKYAAESAGILPAESNPNFPEIVKLQIRKPDYPVMIHLKLNGVDLSMPEDIPTGFLRKLLEAAAHGTC